MQFGGCHCALSLQMNQGLQAKPWRGVDMSGGSEAREAAGVGAGQGLLGHVIVVEYSLL